MTDRRRPRRAGASGTGGVRISSSAASASGYRSKSRSRSVSLASSSGSACTVTLGGSGSRAHVLGMTFGLAAVDGDRAVLRVDGRDITCDLGRSVSVGALRLTCTATTDDAVTFTVARG